MPKMQIFEFVDHLNVLVSHNLIYSWKIGIEKNEQDEWTFYVLIFDSHTLECTKLSGMKYYPDRKKYPGSINGNFAWDEFIDTDFDVVNNAITVPPLRPVMLGNNVLYYEYNSFYK